MCTCGREADDECAQCGAALCGNCLLTAFGLVLCPWCEANDDAVSERGDTTERARVA